MSRATSDVFISYSKDARPWAEKLSKSLERKGVSTWTDFSSIRPGQRWQEEIQRALDGAKYFLLVVGPKNAIGEWQDREWQGALQRTWSDPSKKIIPILIRNATPPSFLKDWGSVRLRAGETDSFWIDKIYHAVRGNETEVLDSPGKAAMQSSRALSTRLAEIENAVRRLKSSQG